MSSISVLHYLKLIYRSALFIIATVVYILNPSEEAAGLLGEAEHRPVIMFVIWLVFAVEMVFRFFPSSVESMGCQKQFKRNYKPINSVNSVDVPQSSRSIIIVAILWILLNAVFGVLYYTEIIDAGMLVLISLAFSVCDMICILFFCPFQTWIMKNKCCTSCRIYNWDYAMMFTPLVFIKDLFTVSIVLMALILLIRWELTAHIHPERFSEKHNCCLSCSECWEKLCHHKRQLRHFLDVNKKQLHLKGNAIIQSVKELAEKKK